MSAAPLAKLAVARLPEILPRLDFPEPLSQALAACPSVPDALELLVARGMMTEAVKLLSFAMPRREVVWWVCMCARHTAPAELPPADAAVLEAAELWVRRPTDESRRAAFACAEKAKFASPEAWAGVAAFWSGGSMSLPDLPPVETPPHLQGLAVNGAILLSSVREKPARQAERMARFIASAREIAAGGTGRLPQEPA
jgi:hypothetical protein